MRPISSPRVHMNTPAYPSSGSYLQPSLRGGAWLDGGGQSIAYLRPARCGVERAQPIARDGAPRSLALSLARARARTRARRTTSGT